MIFVNWKINGSKNYRKTQQQKVDIAGAADEPTFSTVEQINAAFKNDILRRKENWKYLCHICDYATNHKGTLTTHLTFHGIGARFKCDKCDKDFAQKGQLKEHRETHTNIACSTFFGAV